MRTIWIPQDEFKPFIWSFGNAAQFENVDEKIRWAAPINEKVIIRPIIKLTRWQHFKAIFA